MKKTNIFLMVLLVTQIVLWRQVAGVAKAQAATENPTEAFDVGEQTFIISAYYSPLPGQQRYATGSYNGDIRLNGDGVKAADGTEVYPGMVAAPKSYAFGTKMKIPGIGVVAIHDRGGAIVPSGQRGNAYDRLDVWMGYGDAGLQRALKWGKRTLDVTVYGINDNIIEDVSFDGYSEAEKFASAHAIAVNNVPANEYAALITSTLTLGSQGEEVAKIQNILKDLQYYHGEITSVFDEATQEAVVKFQLDENIVTSVSDYGSGFVGPQTAKVLASKLDIEVAKAATDEFVPVEIFSRDLALNDSGDDVRLLQEELQRIHLLGIEPTGFYGDVTAHAVFKFQQTQQLLSTESEQGAGVLGPKTREVLNSLVVERQRTEKLVVNKKPEDLL